MGLKNVDGFWFSWDDNKSERNWRIREFNFEAAIEVFFDEYAEFSGNMEWKGEERYQVIGNVPHIGVIVVISRLGISKAPMKKSIASSQPGRAKRRSAKGISAGSNNEAPVFRVPGAKVGPGAATRRNTKADLREVPMLPPETFRHVGPITTWAKSRPNKKQLTIRLDQNVYDWLKSKGPGYQSLLNGILREVMLAEQRQ